MKSPLVRTTHANLERFLLASTSVARLWNASSNDLAFDEINGLGPYSVAELLSAIRNYAPDSASLYVFSDEDDPITAVHNINLDSVPEVDDKSLTDYVIRAVRGSDFLWVACSQEQASNGDYITVLPAKHGS